MRTDAVPGLRFSDFEGRIGEVFAIGTEIGVQTLELVDVARVPESPRPEGGFRLEFAGASEPRLPQAIYRFVLGDTPHEIFIVAIGYRPEGGLRYEAVFF